jgi:uncharacterized protein with GYD domain
MVKHVSLMTLTDEGRRRHADAAGLFAEAVAVTEATGGKLLGVYALDGRFDFLSIGEWPTPEAAFESRVKLLELNIVTVESFEAFDMDFYLSKV